MEIAVNFHLPYVFREKIKIESFSNNEFLANVSCQFEILTASRD